MTKRVLRFILLAPVILAPLRAAAEAPLLLSLQDSDRLAQLQVQARSLPRNGDIVSEEAYGFPAFEDSTLSQTPSAREHYETNLRRQFEAAALTTDIRAITYLSDGLKVKGFILRPTAAPSGVKLPVLIYNRGGNRDYGALFVVDMAWLAKFAQRGYIVLASQYRGGAGGEGQDEFGGRDVQDVLNLLKLARSRPDADPNRIFMAGHSRGGMQTYLAMKADRGIRAAAVMAGECDLKAGLVGRPEMEKSVYERIIPGYARDRDGALADRSACTWAQDLEAPIYILQGDADFAVDPTQAHMLADRLKALGKPYKLEILPGGHNLWFFDRHADAIIGKIDGWFRTH